MTPEGHAPPRRAEHWRLTAGVLSGILIGMFASGSQTARAAWDEIARALSLSGAPERVSANVLSEHEIEVLDRMPPQSQAELLLERSINHYRGANEQIAARVDGWSDHLTLDGTLNRLFSTAFNSDDLRVRAAAIEIDIAARGLEKTSATIDRFEHDAVSGEQAPRVNAMWNIALVANRGVEPERAVRILSPALQDANENFRYWAVEGLAVVGTDEVIPRLLDTFHDDPSPMIRERAACGLAQSGMLNERQRRTAVPRLLEFAQDYSLNDETRKWVFQALRDVTGQELPHDAGAWLLWYSKNNDGRWNPVTRDGV